ncbi:UDP-glucuronosyltransferase 2B31-like [Trichoplusia ni]|uniref:UDP-glucuronosyltransferase n=1 Tax=Trichoplusia ni TaxID=7111 RepID=A0A7E5W4K9_TRINI|nr:UDP-glucuronosyltransferase 2B31-like [Trichoplusia ni]
MRIFLVANTHPNKKRETMYIYFYLLTCFTLCLKINEAAKILGVFPTPSISHQVVFRPLMLELAKRGHDVTVITTDPIFPEGGTQANFTEIDLHDESYRIWREKLMKIAASGKDDIWTFIEGLKMFPDIFEKQLNDENVQRLLRDNKHFDLLILEACFRPALIFSHIYKAPVILMSSLGAMFDNFATVGVPTHPILYPNLLRQKLYNLTMWEKITELYSIYKVQFLYARNLDYEDNLIRKYFGENTPSLAELGNNVDMLFLNVYPVFLGIQPVPPSVVFTGGLHQKPEKPLPEDLKKYLDSSKNGVIYISFGTNVDPTQLPPERIQVLVKAFSELPYDVLWKWNGDELPGRSENIRISKWLPQSDLLKHPKIKVFVTQGGLQSTDEAITAGVPLVGVPIMGDQWYNVEKYVYHKIGVRLDLEDITIENFKNTLLKVIGDDSYRQNIIKLRSLMRDEVQTPLERAVWWTEYVLRHGGAKHLRSPAANISWAEYLELELVLTLMAGLLVALTACVIIAISFYKYFLRKYRTAVKVKSS